LTVLAALLAAGCSESGKLGVESAPPESPAAQSIGAQHVLTEADLARVPGVAAVMSASGARAADAAAVANSCQWQWKVPSPLLFIQSNGYWVTLYLKQQGQLIWGMAGYREASGKEIWGNVSGSIGGNRFWARIYWTYSGVSAIGVYGGEIGPWKWIWQGITYNQNNPSKSASFSSSGQTPFRCEPSCSFQ
jgi:hypothetical protein